MPQSTEIGDPVTILWLKSGHPAKAGGVAGSSRLVPPH